MFLLQLVFSMLQCEVIKSQRSYYDFPIMEPRAMTSVPFITFPLHLLTGMLGCSAYVSGAHGMGLIPAQ